MHGDDGDGAGIDVLGEHLEGSPLRRVADVPTGHEEHLAVAEVRRQGRAHRRALVGAVHHDHAPYVGQRQRRAHGPGDHGHPQQGQQNLVDLRADPCAGPRSDHYDGGIGLGRAGHVGEPRA